MNKFIIYFSSIIFLYSCSRLSPEEKAIKNALGEEINIELFDSVQHINSCERMAFNDFRNKYKYISLVYLETSCIFCYPKYVEWQTRMDSLNLKNDYTVLFIIQGKSFKRFLDFLHQKKPEYKFSRDRFFVAMDPDYRFLDKNVEIERWIIEKSLLIDHENKIRLVGPPFASEPMRKLFYRISEY